MYNNHKKWSLELHEELFLEHDMSYYFVIKQTSGGFC